MHPVFEFRFGLAPGDVVELLAIVQIIVELVAVDPGNMVRKFGDADVLEHGLRWMLGVDSPVMPFLTLKHGVEILLAEHHSIKAILAALQSVEKGLHQPPMSEIVGIQLVSELKGITCVV